MNNKPRTGRGLTMLGNLGSNKTPRFINEGTWHPEDYILVHFKADSLCLPAAIAASDQQC